MHGEPRCRSCGISSRFPIAYLSAAHAWQSGCKSHGISSSLPVVTQLATEVSQATRHDPNGDQHSLPIGGERVDGSLDALGAHQELF